MKQDAPHKTDVISRSGAENAVLPLVLMVLNDFHRQNISYCYWKSSKRVYRGLTGEGDLDLLVAKQDQHRAQAILLQRGLKPFPCVACRDHPSILSFLGYDEPSSRLVHLHLHFRLVAGNSLLKNYCLPWQEAILARTIVHPMLPIRMLDPVDEALLLIVRSCLELRRSDPVMLRNWRAATHKFTLDRMELAARGHDIHFISYAPPIRMNPNDPRIHFHEVEVASYPLFDHPPYTLALATKMLEVFESESLDLLHVHYAIPHSVSALLARSMAAPRRLPFVTTLHGTDITLVGSNRSYLPITRFSIEQSDGVTAISRYLLNQTIKEFDIKRPIEVIPNFVNCDLYNRTADKGLAAQWAPNGERILMHLSNFRPVKRLTDTIEIFAIVRAKMPAKLVLIGDGPDRGAAEYLVRKKKLQKDVFFLGKQDNVYEKLAAADLFLLPSQLESFGLAALEAMACEVPVIATNVGGVPEVVEHGVDGFLVEPGDVKEAARYAIDILSRADRGGEMGKIARLNAKKNFCANDVIPAYETYYKRILAES